MTNEKYAHLWEPKQTANSTRTDLQNTSSGYQSSDTIEAMKQQIAELTNMITDQGYSKPLPQEKPQDQQMQQLINEFDKIKIMLSGQDSRNAPRTYQPQRFDRWNQSTYTCYIC